MQRDCVEQHLRSLLCHGGVKVRGATRAVEKHVLVRPIHAEHEECAEQVQEGHARGVDHRDKHRHQHLREARGDVELRVGEELQQLRLVLPLAVEHLPLEQIQEHNGEVGGRRRDDVGRHVQHDRSTDDAIPTAHGVAEVALEDELHSGREPVGRVEVHAEDHQACVHRHRDEDLGDDRGVQRRDGERLLDLGQCLEDDLAGAVDDDDEAGRQNPDGHPLGGLEHPVLADGPVSLEVPEELRVAEHAAVAVLLDLAGRVLNPGPVPLRGVPQAPVVAVRGNARRRLDVRVAALVVQEQVFGL
mmetsp:Transcript_72573/g.190226  ORF Transcript_72573/g.190226 Transcript_72573/m.190226 type:complete len:302 (-) Transcript_72573:999-1904(-)